MRIDLRNEPRIERTIYPRLLTEDSEDVRTIKREVLKSEDGKYKMPLRELEICVLDFSGTIDGSHKGIKAVDANDFLYQNGIDIGLIKTSGHGGPALHRVSESQRYQDHPHQIVQCRDAEKLDDLIVIDRMSSKIPRIYVALPNRKWFKSENWFRKDQLEKWWKDLIRGKFKDYSGEKLDWIVNYLGRRGLNPENVRNVSNISDYSDDVPYLIPEVKQAVKDCNLCIVQVGIGELARGFQEARLLNKSPWDFLKFWKKDNYLLFVTSEAHPFAGNNQKKSAARKLDMLKYSKDCRTIKKKADEETYFLAVPDSVNYEVYGNLDNLRKEKEISMRTSTSGCIGFSALKMAEPYEEGLVIPGTYSFEQHPNFLFSKRAVDYDLFINPGDKICIVNTGGAVD